MQHFKDRQRQDEIKERLMNPSEKPPEPKIMVSSSSGLPQRLTPSKPTAEKAFFTTAPFLNQPTAEQQKEMSNFSPTTDQLFAKLNSKIENLTVDQEKADETYYGESDDKYYREWTEKQQVQIDHQRKEAEEKYKEELKEFKAQKEEWEAYHSPQGEASEGKKKNHTRNSVIIMGAENMENQRDQLLEKLILKPKQEKERKEEEKQIQEELLKDEDRKFDDATMKLILSTFYAVNKPEKLGLVNNIVENWVGDKAKILLTLEEKYDVEKITWKQIVKGSWIPNTLTRGGELDEANEKEIDNLIEQYKHHHKVEETGNHNTFESVHQAEIVQQHIKDGIYKHHDSVIVAGSYHDHETIDLVVHNLHYKIPEEGKEEEKSTWDWVQKIKNKESHWVHCRVTPILLNNSLLTKDMVETTAVELIQAKSRLGLASQFTSPEAISLTRRFTFRRLAKNEDTGMLEKWSSFNATFDLVITIQNPHHANNAIYGLQVEVYEVTRKGTEVQLGYVHIPLEDMEGYMCFKKDEPLSLNRWLRQYNEEREPVFVANAIQPMVGMTMCYRQGPAKHDRRHYVSHKKIEEMR